MREMVEKISVTTMLFLVVVVIVASVLGTVYTASQLGLVKFSSQQSPASTGLLTVNVRVPDTSVTGGVVAVNVVGNESAGIGGGT